MPDGSTTPLTDAALTPDPGVRTITSGGAINGSIPAGRQYLPGSGSPTNRSKSLIASSPGEP